MKCIICYQKNVNARLNTCFHEFCGKCILNWFNVNRLSYSHFGYAKCPICRAWFLKKSIRKIKVEKKINKVVYEKRITRSKTKETRQGVLKNFICRSLEDLQNENFDSEHKLFIINNVYKKLYENKWFLYEENSNNINEFGKVVYEKLCELDDDINGWSDYSHELKIWKYKLRFLKPNLH